MGTIMHGLIGTVSKLSLLISYCKLLSRVTKRRPEIGRAIYSYRWAQVGGQSIQKQSMQLLLLLTVLLTPPLSSGQTRTIIGKVIAKYEMTTLQGVKIHNCDTIQLGTTDMNAVLVIMGAVMFVKNNKAALMINHLIIISGMLLIGIVTFSFEMAWLDAPLWMILTGLGLYMGYVPFNSIFFDRLIATFRYAGTVGFVMYVADAFGYLGSVGVMFLKEFSHIKLSWLEFFISTGYIISVFGTLLILGSMVYFHLKHINLRKPDRSPQQLARIARYCKTSRS